jgi:L-threonylcarbamoyladenylate synthase
MPRVSLPDLIAGIRTGHQVASFPTDTLPALAVQPERADLLFATKQRSLDKPLILMAGDIDDLWTYVTGTVAEQAIWQRMAQTYWPGALTLVLPASDRVPPTLNPKNPTTLGIRVPNHPLARTILRQTGPLATTSANISGQPALSNLDEIAEQFPRVLTLAPEELSVFKNSFASELESVAASVKGIPSTVIRWNGDGWTILRQGTVMLDLE